MPNSRKKTMILLPRGGAKEDGPLQRWISSFEREKRVRESRDDDVDIAFRRARKEKTLKE